MNLYKVLFRHVAPKDSAESILGYVLAENDEQVYEQVKEKAYWDDEDEIESWDDEKDEEIIITKKEHMINLKGDYFDEDSDYSDAYYGISEHGWELVQENISEEDIQVLKKLNILTLEN